MQNQTVNDAIPTSQNDSTNLAEITISLRRILALTDTPIINDDAIIILRHEAECALEAAGQMSLAACVN